MSLILRPPLPLNELSRVTLFIAVAIADTLQSHLGLEPGIKWPNDILIKERKISGILTEAVTDMDGIEYIVTGIGLNVNQLREDFPEEFRQTATSVLEEVGHHVPRIPLLQELLLQLEKRYQQLLRGGFADILEKVRELSTVIGKDIKLDGIKGVSYARAIDIDNNGFLMVRDAMGNIHQIMSGEVFLHHPADESQ